MSKTFTITMYSDPGHGWGKVKREVLVNLGIADKISRYSYVRGDYAYLEEDCDLTTLCMALNERDTRVKFVEKHSNRDSKIRSYERYEYGFERRHGRSHRSLTHSTIKGAKQVSHVAPPFNPNNHEDAPL
jgi:hypothetical protein